MVKFILKYWWLLLLTLAGLMIWSIPAMYISETLSNILLIPLFLNLLALPISQIVLLCRKKWGKALISFFGTLGILVILWFPSVMAAMSAPDYFGKKHPIPEGLEYYEPLEENSPAEIDSLKSETYLQLWNDFQGGLYCYDFYYPSLPSGDIFLRAYEVTKNIPLHLERLEPRSTVSIDSTATFSQLVDNKKFTLYYGDWGDFYAARFEVWHRNAVTGEETKLLEKIYRVEGWMR